MTSSQSSSYFMEAENIAEMARLMKQARLFSATTGLLPPTVKLTGAATVLDVGSGPGEWAMAVAQQFPACSVTGIDTSQIMTHYATASARVQELPIAPLSSYTPPGATSLPEDQRPSVLCSFHPVGAGTSRFCRKDMVLHA